MNSEELEAEIDKLDDVTTSDDDTLDGVVGNELDGAYFSAVPKATPVFKQIYRGHKLEDGHAAVGNRPRPAWVTFEPLYKVVKKDNVVFASPVGEPVVGFATGEGVPEGAKVNGWVVTVLHEIHYEDDDPCPEEEHCKGFYRKSYGVFVFRKDVTKFVHREFADSAMLHWRGCEDEIGDVDGYEIPAKTAFDKEWKGGYFEVADVGIKPPNNYGAVITIEPTKVEAVLRWEATV